MKEVRLDIPGDVQKSIDEINVTYQKRTSSYALAHSLYEKGIGYKRIAKILNYSPTVIYTWLYGNVRPSKTFSKEIVRKLRLDLGLDVKKISDILGIKPESVYHHTRKKPREEKIIKISNKTLKFIKNNPISTDYLKYFWKKKILKKNTDSFKAYCKFIKLIEKVSVPKLSKSLGKSISTLRDWKKNRRLPTLTKFLELYLETGKSQKGKVWLSLDLTREGLPKTKMIQVPTKISDWKDITNVLDQLEYEDDVLPQLSKEECLGFLLGIYVGDACKYTENKDNVGLVLSKKYPANEKLGNFFCQCIEKLGFRAYRVKDYKNKFKWRSQESPFFSWVYTVSLGLKEKETTTYHSIKASWLLNAPLEVVKRFLQGVYESDGCVTYEGVVKCSSYPNNVLMQKLLRRFGINSSFSKKKKWAELSIYGNSLKKCGILFAEEIKTERYRKLQLILNAKRLSKGKKYQEGVIKNLKTMMKTGIGNYQVSKNLLINNNLFIPKTTLQYYRTLFNLNTKNHKIEENQGGDKK